MSKTRVIAHHSYTLTDSEGIRVGHLARQYLSNFPEIRLEDMFRPLRAGNFEDLPTLHLDDASSITGMKYFPENVFLQDRARLRAGTRDIVATCTPACETFEHYCTEMLALGKPRWLRVEPTGDLTKLAAGCWTDRKTRETLVHLLKKREFARIHPYMGNFHSWALGQLLSNAVKRPLEVLAPPPGLVRRVNEKTWFASLVTRLLGKAYIPESHQVYNYATLAMVIKVFLEDTPHIVVKLPDSAGGKGNLLLDLARYKGESIGAIRARLKEELRPLHWEGQSRLLVSCWEEAVICSPSAQLWIPPLDAGEVVIEGLYNQNIMGTSGDFMGSSPVRFPDALEDEMTRSCALIGSLFQQLGYVGRCSFDMLVLGEELANGQLKFIECNGRWGGTSGPMSLMNRWFDDWTKQPYSTRKCHIPGIERLAFSDLLEAFRNDLFQVDRQTGWLAFLDASGLHSSSINVLALGDDIVQAQQRVNVEVPRRLLELCNSSSVIQSSPNSLGAKSSKKVPAH
jgi:hypothetical protein